MLISNKQHEANCKNSQQSSGPVTPEGKNAVRLNAVTHGLRARTIILSNEKAEEYDHLWCQLVGEWHPEGPTERLYLETAVTSQWLLARVTRCERRIYEDLNADLNGEFEEKCFRQLALVVKQRTQLERSFRTAIQDLKQAQQERQAQPKVEPKVQPVDAANKPAESPAESVHHPAYVMAEPAGAHPICCSPIDSDTR